MAKTSEMDVMVDYTDMERYLEDLEAHGRRETTISGTRVLLRSILREMAKEGRPTTADSIRTEDVEWVYYNFPGVSEQTRIVYAHTVSRMCVKLGGPNHIKMIDALSNRHVPKRNWITLDEFAALYKRADPPTRMVLVLGAFMGLRRFEMAGLRDDEIDMIGRTMTVRGKGHGKDGLVVRMDMPDEVIGEIERFRAYKDATAPREEGSACLVQMIHYGRWVDVEPSCIGDHVRDLGRECGIRVTPHALRRLYATILTNDVGAELETVRRLMRHSDISTTLKCYVYPDPSKPRRAMEMMSGIIYSALAE